MSTTTAVTIMAVLFLTTGFQQAKPKSDWLVFSPEDGGFSVMLPRKPTQRDLRHDTKEGQTLSPLYELTHQDFKYVVSYMNHPVSVESDERDKLLSMAAEAGIAGAGGRIDSNTPISLDGFPGREVKGEVRGLAYRSRVYLVGRKLYALIVWLPSNKAESGNAAKFFNSFKVVAPE